MLTRDTGHDRDYGANPYVGYDEPDCGLLAPLPDGTDDRLLVKERVIGLGEGTAAVAVTRELDGRRRCPRGGSVEIHGSGRRVRRPG